MKNSTLLSFFAALFLVAAFTFNTRAQGILSQAQVNGNFQMDAQYYQVDSAIGAYAIPEKMLMNSWTNVTYVAGDFSAGMRFETYLNPISGYYKDLKGSGVPFWYAGYKSGQFEITAGNFYEQFGSGMVLRAYEEHNLGYDNALNGVRVKFTPFQGVTLKGIWGTQRYFWQKSPGIIRGGDVDIALNDAIKAFENSKLKLQIGGSFVSKFQDNEEISIGTDTTLKLPLNVGAASGRFNLTYGKFGMGAEYAYKINDPNASNKFIYRKGQGLLLNVSYSEKGFGVLIQAKRLDNMSFKSKRTETGNVLDINYLPAITKQHTYTLAALYPYATQTNGEMGLEGQLNYKFKKETLLGGHYGTDISLNFSQINSIDKTAVGTDAIDAPGTLGYESDFFKVGDKMYFRDINLEISHKFTKSFKASLNLMRQDYDPLVNGHEGEPMIHSNLAIAELTYKFTTTHALRGEFQILQTKQDQGDWAMAMFEYSIAPLWFFSVADQWNFGNENSDNRFHYPLIAAGYNNNANRIQVSYGKQRAGIVCVGGVCRPVPASNGFTVTITSSF
ncbi:MAG: hypothetical protein IPH88_17640 [Bacteroidales bacterium]|nr:hypothetical protein [Bacteroidales bacterium]